MDSNQLQLLAPQPLQTPIDHALLRGHRSGAYDPNIPRDPLAIDYFSPPIFLSQMMEAEPLPSIIIPYGFAGAPISAVPQEYPQWTIDEVGRKKPCWQLLLDRLDRGHGGTLSEEFHAFAQVDRDKTKIMLSERGTQKNYPYANLDDKVQDTDFSVGSNI